MDKLCWGARKKGGVHFRAKLEKKSRQQQAATRLATSPVHFPCRVSATFPFYSILFLSGASEKKYYLLVFYVDDVYFLL